MDKGFGKFGSYEWHKNQIDACESQEQVIQYVFDLKQIKLPSFDTLDESKEKAIELVRVH